MTRHNKLTLGLLLPELAAVPEFSLPVDHTVLLPDYRLAELQNCVAEMFPAMKPSPSVNIGKEESVAGGISSKPECLFGLAATPEQDWGPAASEQLRAQVRVHRMVEVEVALAAERR